MEDSWEMVDKGEGSTENVTAKAEEDKDKPNAIDQTQDDVDDIVLVDPTEGEQLDAMDQLETVTPVPEDHLEEITPIVKDLFASQRMVAAKERQAVSAENETKQKKSVDHADQMSNRVTTKPDLKDKLIKDHLASVTYPGTDLPVQPMEPEITPRHVIKLQTDIDYEMDTDEEEDLLSPRSFADVQRMLAGYRDSEVRSVKIYTPEELDQMMVEAQNEHETDGDLEIEKGKKNDKQQHVDDKEMSDKPKINDEKHISVKGNADDSIASSDIDDKVKHSDKVALSVVSEDTADGKEDLPDSQNAKETKQQQNRMDVEELFEGDTRSDATSDDEGADYTLDYTLEDIEEAIDEQVIWLFHIYRPQTKFAKVMFLQVSVCPQGGRAWLLRGGMRGCSRGGMRGCSGGACVVAPGGVCVVAPGGVHGFSMRYGQ